MAADSTGARLLQGAPIAAEIRASVKDDVAAFKRRHGYAPSLSVVIVGRDAPSIVYLQQILRSCRNVGINGSLVEIPGRVSAAALKERIEQLNADPLVSGIIVQMPLPRHIPLSTVTDTIDPSKDIDGINLRNAGLMTLGYEGFLPTTAQAAVEILKRSGIRIEGARAAVIGRSNVVGKPGLVTGRMLKRGAVVVDVGINVVDGRIVGDVDFDSAKNVASAITPVPGGVGPVTNALLLTHLLRAAKGQVDRARRGGRPAALRTAASSR